MPAVPPLLVCLGRGRLKLLPLLLDCAEKTENKIQNIFDNTWVFFTHFTFENGCFAFIQIFEN